MQQEPRAKPAAQRKLSRGTPLERVVVALLLLSLVGFGYAVYLLVIEERVAGQQLLGGVALVWLIAYLVTIRTRPTRRRRY